MNYLCTYRPLCCSEKDGNAIDCNLPPFLDASCRREPAFESKYPSITSLCRGAFFAPRLRVGDSVVYIGVKRAYFGLKPPHWRAVAILKVIKRLPSHAAAAKWYAEKEAMVPSNCIVPGNGPIDEKLTDFSPEAIPRAEKGYAERSLKYPHYCICASEDLNLHTPPVFPDALMRKIFGQIPNLRYCPEIPDQHMPKIRALFKDQGNGKYE